jgi:D-alanyl-D-alanine carboxypeptidase (penicillin-binding protein 5/6)
MALAEHVAGSDTAFTDLMNQQAQQLGMKETHFMNPEGLDDPNHLTTPYDLAILSKAIIDNHPDYYKIYAEKEYVYNGIKQGNRNTLLYKDNTVDGLKTGHTDAAGFCLAASAVRSGMRLISVVMGTDSMKAREIETAKLLDYGFRYYQTNKLYSADQVLQTVRVWKGVKHDIKLGVKNNVAVTLPRGQETALKTTITLQGDLKAPLTAGQTVGKIDIALKDKPYASIDLIALESVDQANFFKRLLDSVLLFFHHLMS